MALGDAPVRLWRANSTLQRITLLCALGILVLIAYLPALQVSFLSDDYAYLAFAQYGPSDWSILAVNPQPWSPFYRPLGLVAWKALFWLFGNWPFGYHLFSIGLHWLNCSLVVALTRIIAPRSTWIAIAAGTLFALLPSQVETVVWLSAIFDLLATGWYLTALICALIAWQTRRPILFMLAIGAYQLCIWSKEIAFSLPVLLLLLGLAGPRRGAPKQLIGVCLLLSAIAGVNLLQRYLVWGSLGGYAQVPYTIGWYGLARLVSALAFLLAPLHQQLFPILLLNALMISMLALLGIGVLVSAERRILVLAAGWLIITLLPVANVLPVLPDLQQSRYLYLPSVGFCFGLAAAIEALAKRFAGRRRLAALLGSLGIIAALYTFVVRIHEQPWLVASRAADNIADTIHRLIPSNRPGSVLHVTSLPDNYAGAYIYRLGIDLALLTRYGQLFEFWPETNITPIPYKQIHISGDYYEVNVIYNQKTHGWDTIGGRAVTTSAPQPPLRATHWLVQMSAGSVLSALRNTPVPTASAGDRSWDFTACHATQEWTLLKRQAACSPGEGWEFLSQEDDIALESPTLQIRHEGWVEVIVALEMASAPPAEANASLSWKNDRADWHYRQHTAINLPPDVGERSYHYFIRLDAQPIAQMQLDLAHVPGKVLIKRITVHPVP